MTGPAGPPGPVPPGPYPPPDAGATACARHPDRPTRLQCTRCGRPACPDCLREASVGYHCVDCVSEATRSAPRWRTVAGASRVGKPVMVPILIAINVAIFALTVAAAGSVSDNYDSELFARTWLVPALVADGEWWRLLTAGFLHFGLLHLAFNMFAMWVIGREVETVLGRWRLLAVYLVSLLGGSAAVMLFSGAGTAVAGASGAVFGLMGALAVLLYRLKMPAGQAIGLIVINIVISLVIPGISLTAHLGGLVVGAATTAALVYLPNRQRPAVQAAAVAGIAVVVLLAIGASLAL
ncbi:rhomboid family intramembrane serine protease [Pseudonocardia sp. KRD291]|uniref:rhomboid family intramembrane serine protease n=1 Tax=Pseudonocardia sp. KRD291 TaxID=2792007 RepID=UPI001C4A28F9|nr:rhomboid family intramembrane serine protease [Pseudonocardia sp. KRD291]MBW0103113.1 rhomboid family intramembrane serine protease [Pseudonocardia sp. KRD291]